MYKTKKNISLRLKVSVLSAVRTCSGKLFHDLAAATLKARSPNLRRVLGTWKSDLVAERRIVPRDASEGLRLRCYCVPLVVTCVE